MMISKTLDALITELLDYWCSDDDYEAYPIQEDDIADWFWDTPVDELLDVLTTHPDIDYQKAAAYALVACGHVQALPRLKEIRRTTDDDTFYEVASWGCLRFDQWAGLDTFWEALTVWAEANIPQYTQMELWGAA